MPINRFTDAIDAACQFSEQFELKTNKPDYDFMRLRMTFLAEEVGELEQALVLENDVEVIDGAIDVAFVAITQAYHLFRHKGFSHTQSVGKVRSALLEVCETNLSKEPPTEPGEKIRKPEGWVGPRIAELLVSHGGGFAGE